MVDVLLLELLLEPLEPDALPLLPNRRQVTIKLDGLTALRATLHPALDSHRDVGTRTISTWYKKCDLSMLPEKTICWGNKFIEALIIALKDTWLL